MDSSKLSGNQILHVNQILSVDVILFFVAGGAQSNVPAVTGEVVNGNVVNGAEVGGIAGAPGYYLILLLKTGTVGI